MYRGVPVIARPAFSLRMLRLACLPAVVQFLMMASVSVGVDPRCSVQSRCCVQNPNQQACFCSFTNSAPRLLMSGFPFWWPATVCSFFCRCIVSLTSALVGLCPWLFFSFWTNIILVTLFQLCGVFSTGSMDDAALKGDPLTRNCCSC